MNPRRIRLALAVVGLACAAQRPSTASAIPAFSRQIHAGCYTCHFQSMGALNRFGREFMMNNFGLTPKMRRELMEREKRERRKHEKEAPKKGR